MKIEELLEKKEKGTYAGAHFSQQTMDDVEKYIKNNKIPNPIDAKKLHITILYSRKFLPDYKPAGEYEKPLGGKPVGFEVWKGTDKDGEKNANCLVQKFDCPELHKRHKELMDEHDATYDYDEYKTHFTLSYDIGDFDISDLPPYDGEIKIVDEYGEDLDLDWAMNKGTKK